MNDRDSIRDANPIPTEEGRGEALVAKAKPRPDLSAVRAVFFDLDDTLCTYWEASKIGLHRAFVAHGPEGFEPEEMVRHWAAAFREYIPEIKTDRWYPGYLKSGEPSRTEQMRRTLVRVGVVDEERAARLSQSYMEERDRALRLFEDAEEVLRLVKAHYPVGLITNGPADIQRQEIATLGIERFIDHFFIEGEVGEGKPSPRVFRRAEQAVGQPPQRILMVGNSYRHDIVPAIEAGWRTAWIRRPSDVAPSTTGDAKPEELPQGGLEPDLILNHLSELLPILGLVP